MIGVIMAGGKGTRLRPITATRPKPMVRVLGRPVIDYLKDTLVEGGINEIVLTTGYRGRQLEDHVATWSAPGLHASVNQEATPMGTAGSVGLLRDRLTSTFVVGSGDGIISFDLTSLIQRHRSVGAIATMALWEVEDPSPFGIVGLGATPTSEVDGSLDAGWIRRFKEKPTKREAFSKVINAGLYVLEPEVLDHIPLEGAYDFSKDLFPRLLELGLPLHAARIDGVWFDVGRHEEVLRAQDELMELSGDAIASSESWIHPDAIVEGACHSSVVEAEVLIDDGSRVEGSLLMRGTHVGPGCVIRSCLLGESVRVGTGSVLSGIVVGDGEVIEAGTHMEAHDSEGMVALGGTDLL